MNIGIAAKRSGLPAKTIRYYEEIGLLVPGRAENGYREYSEADVHRLTFLHRARNLGFSVDECRLLLSLYDDPHRASSEVKAIALDRIREIDRRIEGLASMRATLSHLAAHCHGDQRPECPILDDLAGFQDTSRN
ncbi:MAG: Cu(I)-responsive transcriptional regulator [Pseudomonadales bacterium]